MITICGNCNVDSAGNHEWGCPLSPKTYPGPQVDDVVRELHETITRLRIEARKWELKANQLHDFCPDHRDKQRGKPCLACEVERLRALVAVGREMAKYVEYSVLSMEDRAKKILDRWRSLEEER